MAEMTRQLTQAEINRILFNQSMGLDPRGQVPMPSVQNIQQRTSGTITPVSPNFAQLAAGGANRVGQFLNQILPNAQQAVELNPLNLERLFPTVTAQPQVTIPTGFNFAPKQAPTGEVIPGGLQSQQVNLNQLLSAIKPADVLGVSGAERAYTDVGMGKAPNPMDVAEILALGSGGMAAGRGLLKAGKGLPVGMSIQDVSKASEFVQNVPAGQEMIVMHNLSADKLKYADKIGGLPVPSLGVGKSSEPFSSFGEITLIAPKDFAIPSAKNPVFRADAYTKRFPSVDYIFDNKSNKAIDEIFSPLKEKIPKDTQYRLSSFKDDWKYHQDSDAFKYKFLDENNMLPNKDEFKDSYNFNREVRNIVDQSKDKYDEWLSNFENILSNSGALPKEKIFKGFSPSGNRRYSDVSLENIVKEMKGGAAEEGWNYGAGTLRAAVSPKFKNLAEIKSSRGLLVSNEKMSEVKDKVDVAYNDLLKRLSELDSKYDASDAMLEVAQTKNFSALNRIYGNVPDVLKLDMKVFFDSFRKMPAEYFEIKPQRAVSIEEFSGAIIPKNSSNSVREILKNRGIKDVYEYATPEERIGLMQRFGKEMFVGAPIGAGLLGSEEER
jgi:hypothetical protein